MLADSRLRRGEINEGVMISRMRIFMTKQSATTIGFYAGSVAVVVGAVRKISVIRT